MHNNIPLELQINLPWICWLNKQETPDTKPVKVPINPHNGQLASVTNPNTWGTFELCCQVKDRVSGLGGVLLASCGYTCIDLDETDDPEETARHYAIIEAFDSYTELSQSGKGYHIWISAVVPSGRRRSKVEMYSDGRYMATTGNVVRNVPIKEQQELAMQLWEELGKEKIQATVIDKPQIVDDYTILKYASEAVNGDKFIDLFEGRWQVHYPSQSEADFALANIVGFYTQNREQVIRIFQSSVLGKRAKSMRDLKKYIINRVFDNQLPECDLDGMRNNLEQQLAAKNSQKAAVKEISASYVAAGEANEQQLRPDSAVMLALPPETVKSSKLEYSLPPGLLGQIAHFIYSAAPRPVPEIAIAGAIGLMSGVCGRAYNISGTGLNTYTFLLAKTGRGKEAMGRGINKLIAEAIKTVPASTSFVGPTKISSPQALVKYLYKMSNSFVSILGEFPDTLKRMSNDSRNPIQQDVRIAFLDLYNKSGHGDILGSIIYADKDKNTEVSTAPAFSLIGEGIPEKFYELLTKDMILEGLLPRCTIIEYHGSRQQLNELHLTVKPSTQLMDQFSALCAYCLQLNNGNNVINVQMDSEAQQLISNFDKMCDKKINEGDTVSAELWTRAHMKVLKMSALLAVGCNYINPIINKECAEWSLKLIINDVTNLLKRFETGDIGATNVQNEQTIEVHKAFKKYVSSEWEKLCKLPGATQQTWDLKIIPHSFITAFCRQRACFKNDKLGPIHAVKNCLTSLVDCGEIIELTPQQKCEKALLGSAKLYAISGMQL